MDTSAAFLRWVPGGTSSICILYSPCIIVFRGSDTSFSNMCFLVIISALCGISIILRYARVSSASLQLFMGSTSIALLSILTITMMYLFHRCDHVGNYPVWSEKTVFLTSYMLMYTSCTLHLYSVPVLVTSRGVSLVLVDLKFFLDWFRCPFGVSVVSGSYLATLCSFSIGRLM